MIVCLSTIFKQLTLVLVRWNDLHQYAETKMGRISSSVPAHNCPMFSNLIFHKNRHFRTDLMKGRWIKIEKQTLLLIKNAGIEIKVVKCPCGLHLR